ncbi:hypothetical protein [Cryobacterium fucosi]|uniref:Uncharacterized protein n=1 Tax=Cryobacterium fucosi TaxID=1259157 RepID=A0A4R9B2R6_9MICO|nr:hypothetical protein [Cryobacterium fucosi]TFD74718.1 hypothetical protein E3T48_12390 [Cryobacterium fucosi]
MLAYQGAMICEGCADRLRSTIGDAADLCAHIRSMVDPLKAQVFDREKLSGGKLSHSPAPVSVDLLDAGTDVYDILSWWASYFGDPTVYRPLPVSLSPEEVHAAVKWPADFLLFRFEQVCNDSWVVMFSRKVIDWPEQPEGPDETEGWTIWKALLRFPLERPAHWAVKPCPACGVRTVRVTPPRRGNDPTLYVCRSCTWFPPFVERELWTQYFEGTFW